MNVLEKFNSLRGRKLEAAEALLDSGAADKALAEKEAATRAQRTKLLDARARVTGPHKALIEAARIRHDAAVARTAAAQAELESAFAEQREAWGSFYAAQYNETRDIAEVDKQLLATADPRVSRFAFILRLLDDSARAGLSFYGRRVKTNGEVGESVAYDSNLAEIKRARAAIAQCIEECDALQQSVATYDDMTARFVSMCERLEEPLAGVECNPPQVDADGNVEKPLRWDAKREWRVEKALYEPRQQPPIVSESKTARARRELGAR